MFHEVLVWHSPGLRRLDGVWKDDFLRNGIHGQRMFTVRCVHPLSLVMTQRFSQALFSVIGLLFTCTFWKLFSPITVLEPRHSTISRRQDARCLDVCFHQGVMMISYITLQHPTWCFVSPSDRWCINRTLKSRPLCSLSSPSSWTSSQRRSALSRRL